MAISSRMPQQRIDLIDQAVSNVIPAKFIQAQRWNVRNTTMPVSAPAMAFADRYFKAIVAEFRRLEKAYGLVPNNSNKA